MCVNILKIHSNVLQVVQHHDSMNLRHRILIAVLVSIAVSHDIPTEEYKSYTTTSLLRNTKTTFFLQYDLFFVFKSRYYLGYRLSHMAQHLMTRPSAFTRVHLSMSSGTCMYD